MKSNAIVFCQAAYIHKAAHRSWRWSSLLLASSSHKSKNLTGTSGDSFKIKACKTPFRNTRHRNTPRDGAKYHVISRYTWKVDVQTRSAALMSCQWFLWRSRWTEVLGRPGCLDASHLLLLPTRQPISGGRGPMNRGDIRGTGCPPAAGTKSAARRVWSLLSLLQTNSERSGAAPNVPLTTFPLDIKRQRGVFESDPTRFCRGSWRRESPSRVASLGSELAADTLCVRYVHPLSSERLEPSVQTMVKASLAATCGGFVLRQLGNSQTFPLSSPMEPTLPLTPLLQENFLRNYPKLY